MRYVIDGLKIVLLGYLVFLTMAQANIENKRRAAEDLALENCLLVTEGMATDAFVLDGVPYCSWMYFSSATIDGVTLTQGSTQAMPLGLIIQKMEQ